MKNKLFTCIASLFFAIPLLGQTIPNTLELNTPYDISRGKEILAKSSIRLLPGFSYKAQVNESLHLRIATHSSDPKINIQLSIDDGQTIAKTVYGTPAVYEAIQIGEYYWMNNYLTLPDQKTVAKEDIDLIHSRYSMFEHFKPKTDPMREDPTFWSYPGVNLEEVNKYYGQHYSRYAMWGIDEKALAKEGNNETFTKWSLPKAYDILQLIGMCGNGTTQEVLQYLAFSYQDPSAPAFTKIITPDKPDQNGVLQGGYYWFYRKHPSPTKEWSANTYDQNNSNKYGFNWVSVGSRFHNDGGNIHTVTPEGQTIAIPSKLGDLNGFDQTGIITMDPKYGKFSLDDYVNMKYDNQWEWRPIRLCRALTDAELGYKLYINHKMPESYSFTTNQGGVPYENIITKEELFLEQVRKGHISISDINIIKIGLSITPPAGYYELDRGYIRGLYVQYILDKGIPLKTVSEIIDLSTKNWRLWVNRRPDTRSIVPFKMEEEGEITVYPNPTSDVLNIKGDGVQKVEIYDLSGRLIKVETNTTSVSLQELNGGMYVVRVTTSTGVSNHKITKK